MGQFFFWLSVGNILRRTSGLIDGNLNLTDERAKMGGKWVENWKSHLLMDKYVQTSLKCLYLNQMIYV